MQGFGINFQLETIKCNKCHVKNCYIILDNDNKKNVYFKIRFFSSKVKEYVYSLTKNVIQKLKNKGLKYF